MATDMVPEAADARTAGVLRELVWESLSLLLRATPLVAWALAVLAVVCDERYTIRACALLGVVLVLVWASASVHEKSLGLAVGVYLAGLTGVVTAVTALFPGSALLYAYMLVVLVAAMLSSPRVTWGVALACVALALLTSHARATPAADLAMPIAFVLLAALTSWLGSRRLFTALDWTVTMTAQAQKSAEDARQRRGEVRGMLKSLDEAYARLERANEALLFAREAAERAYRFKAEFVANVSHELRTPLNLIIGFSEMIATAPESYGGVTLPAAYRGDVNAIYGSAMHLSDLINDVLDLSQIEAGRLPLTREPADLAELVRGAGEMVRGLAEAKGLRLELDLAPHLPALNLDRTRIRQVLLNLLTNATRFTEHGRIRVSAQVEGDEVQVLVEDTGRGIPADRIARAFEAFTQLHEDQARQGSGLGLAVSKRFVELHGGMMWIRSRTGRGTTVGFTLPLPESGKETDLSLRTTGTPRPVGVMPRVVVLHDDPGALVTLRRHVAGYEFLLAGDAQEAARIVREAPPVALVADTAWADAARRLAAECGPRDLPVLVCPLPGPRHAGALLGTVGYMLKPISREALFAAVSRLRESPRSVLVIDDDPGFTRLMGRMLRAAYKGVRVLEAADGQEGLAAARSQRPDVVLLDLLMPQMSGYEFLAEIRRDPELAGTPVIAMTARATEDEELPMLGELRLRREAGFSLTQVLQWLQGALGVLTPPVAEAQASA